MGFKKRQILFAAKPLLFSSNRIDVLDSKKVVALTCFNQRCFQLGDPQGIDTEFILIFVMIEKIGAEREEVSSLSYCNYEPDDTVPETPCRYTVSRVPLIKKGSLELLPSLCPIFQQQQQRQI